jgi:hypothetical protein
MQKRTILVILFLFSLIWTNSLAYTDISRTLGRRRYTEFINQWYFKWLQGQYI